MARSRIELHEKLCAILGSRNCYFEPPANIEMSYPCIRYSLNAINTEHADNKNFINFKRYLGTVITEDCDTDLVDKFLESDIPCKMVQKYIVDGLYHFVFAFYY